MKTMLFRVMGRGNTIEMSTIESELTYKSCKQMGGERKQSRWAQSSLNSELTYKSCKQMGGGGDTIEMSTGKRKSHLGDH